MSQRAEDLARRRAIVYILRIAHILKEVPMRGFIYFTIFVFALNLAAKSSEIPAKREFPVNNELNPCVDFYKYACSKVMDSFQLREDRSAHTFAFSDSNERILEAKQKYFANLSTIEPQGKREASLKTNYVACMNEPARKGEETALVKETRDQVQALATREDLLTLLAKNRLVGRENPLPFGLENNQDRPLYWDITFDTPWMSLPEKSYYEKPEVVAELEKVVTQFFTDIGEKDPAKKAQLVVNFEKGLAHEYPTPVERRNIMSARTGITRAELSQKYPNFKLDEFLTRVPKDTHIRYLYPKAMDYMNAQLAERPLDELKTLYTYYALRGYLDDAFPKYFTARFNFDSRNFGGPTVRPVRAERCTREMMGRFTPEVDSILWPKMFPNFPSDKVHALAEKIRASILTSLKDNKWLSKAARKEAIAKIKTATLQLVSPENDVEWDFRPEGDYDTAKPIFNRRLFARLMTEKDFGELRGPMSPRRWGMGPLTVNAYYDESFNKFVLPVGILQYPFYDTNGPMEVNLAAIGTVVGHELGHGIDDKGSLYDSKGLLRTWMTPADLKEFNKRTEILVGQFTEAGMNGKLTLGENIGDLVGLSASHWAAFGSHFDKSKVDLEKAFFTQYARAWCEVQRPKFAEMRIKQNPHSLGFARVNEQIKQQPAFAEAFQCKASDPMVLPKEKLVHLW